MLSSGLQASGENSGGSALSQAQFLIQVNSEFQFPSALVGQMTLDKLEVELEVSADHEVRVKKLVGANGFSALQITKALEEMKIYLPKGNTGQSFTFQINFQ